jgi:hypothetical protein
MACLGRPDGQSKNTFYLANCILAPIVTISWSSCCSSCYYILQCSSWWC